jgi:hypothetical protein
VITITYQRFLAHSFSLKLSGCAYSSASGSVTTRPGNTGLPGGHVEVKVTPAIVTARSAIQLKTFSYPAEGGMTETEITQVLALSACVSAFVSLVVLAAFR